MVEMEDDDVVFTVPSEPKKKESRVPRGLNFTTLEDLMICKAFISRSEDPIKGTSQKGKVFMAAMHEDYKAIMAAQHEQDEGMYRSSSAATKTAFEKVGFKAALLFNERTALSIYVRFKDTIAPRVMKFLAIEATTERGSGQNNEDYYNACKTIYAEILRWGCPKI
jgi:hypothetical protein